MATSSLLPIAQTPEPMNSPGSQAPKADIQAAGSVGASQNGIPGKVYTHFRNYVVHAVLFGWDSPADPGQVLIQFKNIVGSQLSISITLRSYGFRPRSPPPSYDQLPAWTMMDEVIALLPAKAGSADNEVIVVLSSLLLPTAQGGTEGYFLKDTSSMGERNVAVVWSRNPSLPAFPVRPSLLPFVVAHEFGHFLGYGHEGDPKCIMYLSPLEGSSFTNCTQFPSSGSTQASVTPSPSSLAASKGACIIATTAFGSELAPQVAFLRKFRDTGIGSTSAGRSFMVVFNSWYYSFSPYIANLIGQDSSAKEFTRIAIYPVIGILSISERLQPIFGSELGIVVVGMVAAFAIGLIYLSPLAALLGALLPRSRGAKLTTIYAPLPAVSALLLGGMIGGGWLASASAVALVLTPIVGGAAVGSAVLTSPLRKLVESLG